jgi:hypothetical protein
MRGKKKKGEGEGGGGHTCFMFLIFTPFALTNYKGSAKWNTHRREPRGRVGSKMASGASVRVVARGRVVSLEHRPSAIRSEESTCTLQNSS